MSGTPGLDLFAELGFTPKQAREAVEDLARRHWQPTKVSYVHGRSSSYYEPQLDRQWDEWDQLRWHLATLVDKQGLDENTRIIRVHKRRYWYYIVTPATIGRRGDFRKTWDRLNKYAYGTTGFGAWRDWTTR
jgi:hypothetical protein